MRTLVVSLLLAIAPSLAPAQNTRLLFQQPDASAPASIAFTTESVLVAVDPGARVVLFSSSIRSSGGILGQVSDARVLADEDRDGVIRHRPRHGVAYRSLWVAIDLASGVQGFASPAAALRRLASIHPSQLRRDAEGVLGVFDREQLRGDMVIVRPGEGAWRVRALEGGGSDADHVRNGKLSLAPGDAVAVEGTSPPPKKLKRRDVIALIDPDRLELILVEVD